MMMMVLLLLLLLLLMMSVRQLFCDYVLKNPFYETDQPVRSAKFEVNLDKLIRSKQ